MAKLNRGRLISRLLGVTKSVQRIVEYFGVDMPTSDEVPTETIKGTPGLIVFEILQTIDRWQSGVPPTKAFPHKGNMLM